MAYQSDCVAYLIGDRHLFRLGGHHARTPWMAVAWLMLRAEHIADQLDAPAAVPVRGWMADGREHARAVARLGRGETYSYLVRDGSLVYLLTTAPGVVVASPEP